MTYKQFKAMVTGLLIGDTSIPQDEEVLLSLISYALITVATKAESLHLTTENAGEDILRLSTGNYLIRHPITPVDLDDAMDIDKELVPAVARFVASYVSRDKGGVHVQAANRIITDYNSKVYDILETIEIPEEELDDSQ